MARQPAVSQPSTATGRLIDAGFWLVVVVVGVLVVLVFGSLALGGPGSGPAAGSSSTNGLAIGPSAAPIDVASYLLPAPVAAPRIDLTAADTRPFSLASLRGGPTFVFFGYTHCPDVCPATIGTVGLAMEAFGPGPRAVFVSVDPERDTPAWLTEYGRYLPAGFVALTGTATQIRSTADAWGVRYSRVETGTPGAYSMSHTADVYLVDAGGTLRARFPFGTSSEAMTAVLRAVVASSAAAPAAGPSSTPGPTTAQSATPSAASSASPSAVGAALGVQVVSSSVWSGGPGPVILALSADGARLDDATVRPTVRLETVTGDLMGEPVQAVPVRQPGITDVSWVATLAVPIPGLWRIEVSVPVSGRARVGSASLAVLDPGTTAPIGAPASTVRTPTLADVGGVARAITTDPAPDLRLSERSTTDALAAGQPFVLVVDSSRFRVSPACGRAIVMARYLLDRWRDVAFIHLEPYRYAVVADTAVLDGSLDAPTLTDPAASWGIGGRPWGPRSMPWVFVVDGRGIVRAKYQGVMGTDDVDVILALIAQGG